MEAQNEAETKTSESSAVNDKNKHRSSIRFQLHLADSTDRSFPEFSYLELLGNVKKNKKGEDDVLPPDEDCNMDEIRALAKKFEEKYAPKSVAKHKKARKTDRVQDLVDVTYGYDMTDYFVDDSEAYDELVPADWTTEHGGFYINMGELNFRPISSDDEKSDNDFKDSKKKKITKKKVKDHKEKKMKDGKRLLSSGEKEKNVKKIRLNSEDKEKKVKLKKSVSLDGQSSVSKDQNGHAGEQSPETAKIISMNKLQSPVIKHEKNNISDVLNPMSSHATSISMNIDDSGKENDASSSINGSAAVTLPEGLPPSLILSIQKLIEAARKAGGDGKCKFFNMDVNRILLQIETDSRKLNCRARSAVYDYLALFLPCTKETLLKRAKNLFMQEQVGRLREPLLRLKHAVEAAMPEQIKHYEEEIAKLSEDQAAQSQKPGPEVVSQNGEKKDEPGIKVLEVEGGNDKTDEVTTPTDASAPTTPLEEKGKRTIVPKRFVWKEDIRNLLCDVVRIKVELYLMSKSRSTTAEEALKGYLETEVRPLWPKGWMTTRILYRESKQAHAKVTSTVVPKAKKVLKKAKDEKSAMDSTDQQVKIQLNLQTGGEEKKVDDDTAVTSVSSNVIASTVTETRTFQGNTANHAVTQAQNQSQPETQSKSEFHPNSQVQQKLQVETQQKPETQQNPQTDQKPKIQQTPQSQQKPQTQQIPQTQKGAQTQQGPQTQQKPKLQRQSPNQFQVQSPSKQQAQSAPQPQHLSRTCPQPQVISQPKVQLQSLPQSLPKYQSQTQFHFQPPLQSHRQSQPQIITCGPSPTKPITKPNVTGKTILDLLESSPGRAMQPNTNSIENKSVLNPVRQTTVGSTTHSLPSCSFQNISPQQLAQISPPRNMKPQIVLPVSSPSRSSPSRVAAVNISPVRQTSNIPGKFNATTSVSTKQLPSCSLMSSPTLPTKIKPELPQSPVSTRQNCSYASKVAVSPNLAYNFTVQSPNSSPENRQRTHLNSLSKNFMGMASPVQTNPQLSATSLLSSMARSSIQQNHVPPNSPLVGQSVVPNTSIQNPLPNLPTSLNTNPHNISSIIGIQNKPLKTHGVFAAGLTDFSELPRSFTNQTAMHRNTSAKEPKDGNNTPSSYQPTYRPSFS